MLALQLAAVAGICFNHLVISLLRAEPPIFSDRVYAIPAEWGVALLFLSSGFLTHWLSPSLLPEALPLVKRLTSFVVRRFLWLAIPSFAVFAVDAVLLSYADFGPSPRLLSVTPFVATLTQTWVYGTVGLTSIGQPLNTANMAWIASCLFFMACCYAVVHRLTLRLSATVAIAAAIAFAAGHWAQYAWLNTHLPAIMRDAVELYGDRLGVSYSYGAWLTFYSPYAHICAFLAGVCLAQFARVRTARDPIALGAAVVAGVALFSTAPHTNTAMLGVSMCLFSAILWFTYRAEPSESAWRYDELIGRILLTASGLLIFHLAFYVPLSANAVATQNASLPAIYLFARVAAVTALVMVLSYRFTMFVAEPLRLRILALLEVNDADDRYL